MRNNKVDGHQKFSIERNGLCQCQVSSSSQVEIDDSKAGLFDLDSLSLERVFEATLHQLPELPHCGPNQE